MAKPLKLSLAQIQNPDMPNPTSADEGTADDVQPPTIARYSKRRGGQKPSTPDPPSLMIPKVYGGFSDVRGMAVRRYLENFACSSRAGGSGERIKATMSSIIAQLTKLIHNVRKQMRVINKLLQQAKQREKDSAKTSSKASAPGASLKQEIGKDEYRTICHDLRMDLCDLAVVVKTLKTAICVIKTGEPGPLPPSISDFTWEMYVPDMVSVRERMNDLCELLALNLYNAEIESSGTWPGHGWPKYVAKKVGTVGEWGEWGLSGGTLRVKDGVGADR
jgi:hypothetical protein